MIWGRVIENPAPNTVREYCLISGGKKFKKTPKGYGTNTLYPGYLLYEGIYAWFESSNLKIISGGKAVDIIYKIFKDMLPLHKWLVRNLF